MAEKERNLQWKLCKRGHQPRRLSAVEFSVTVTRSMALPFQTAKAQPHKSRCAFIKVMGAEFRYSIQKLLSRSTEPSTACSASMFRGHLATDTFRLPIHSILYRQFCHVRNNFLYSCHKDYLIPLGQGNISFIILRN